MRTVRGLAADEAWQAPLSASARATVQSSFDHALNIDFDGELLALLSARVGRAPGALLVDAASLPRVPGATPVYIGGGVVRLGAGTAALAVDARGCAMYSSRVSPLEAVAPDLSQTVIVARASLDRVSRPGSFRASPVDDPVEAAVRRRLLSHGSEYQDAVAALLANAATAHLEPRQLDPSVAGLVGLGFGLTPSGDDYLVGSLAVLHHLHEGAKAAHAVGHQVAGLLDQTTAVSSAYLKAAIDGRFQEALTIACRASLTADTDGISRSFADVARHGATSGTDALHGVVDTLVTVAATSHASLPPHHYLQGAST